MAVDNPARMGAMIVKHLTQGHDHENRLPDSRMPDPFADHFRSPFDLGPGDALMLEK